MTRTALPRLGRLAALGLALVALASTATGCKKTAATNKPKGIGRALVDSAARNLVATADGKVLAFVADVEKPPEKSAPEGVFQGILTTVAADGGTPRQLGGGVSTLEDGFRVSPDGKWIAYLQGFRFKDQAGTLQIAPMPEGEARQLATGTTYYQFSRDSRFLGYVASGEMHLVELATGQDQVLAQQVSTFELAADSSLVLMRRPIAAGGELLVAEVGPEPKTRKLGERVGDYNFSPDGTAVAFTARVGGPADPYSLFVGAARGVPARVAEKAGAFAFSPDSAWIAFVAGQEPGRPHGALQIAPVAGGQPMEVGKNVSDFRWSPSSKAVALRESHEDKSGRAWSELKVASLPKGTLRHKDRAGPKSFINYLWSPEGDRLAFLKHVGEQVTLNLLTVEGEEPPRAVAPWVFSYQFAPGRNELWYRANCLREGRQCDLIAASIDDPNRPPVKLAEGIMNFRPSADGKRILLIYPRVDTERATDLGWVELGSQVPSKGIDVYTLPGAFFLDKAGKRLAYLVGERKREGVYVADIP
ncbi:MAG: hypothetical protein ACOX6T_17750 [Myxococcales bacterium]